MSPWLKPAAVTLRPSAPSACFFKVGDLSSPTSSSEYLGVASDGSYIITQYAVGDDLHVGRYSFPSLAYVDDVDSLGYTGDALSSDTLAVGGDDSVLYVWASAGITRLRYVSPLGVPTDILTSDTDHRYHVASMPGDTAKAVVFEIDTNLFELTIHWGVDYASTFSADQSDGPFSLWDNNIVPVVTPDGFVWWHESITSAHTVYRYNPGTGLRTAVPDVGDGDPGPTASTFYHALIPNADSSVSGQFNGPAGYRILSDLTIETDPCFDSFDDDGGGASGTVKGMAATEDATMAVFKVRGTNDIWRTPSP